MAIQTPLACHHLLPLAGIARLSEVAHRGEVGDNIGHLLRAELGDRNFSGLHGLNHRWRLIPHCRPPIPPTSPDKPPPTSPPRAGAPPRPRRPPPPPPPPPAGGGGGAGGGGAPPGGFGEIWGRQ